MARQSSFAQRQLRANATNFLVDKRYPLLALIPLYLMSVASGHLLGGHGYRQGLVDGSLLGLFGLMAGIQFLLHTGSLDQLAGIEGEKRTASELSKALKKGRIWGAVHNIESADGDIDSVVFAPGGILAVETKWRTRSLDRRWMGKDLDQARRGAAKVRSILRTKQTVGEVHDVIPVLVIWGKASDDVAVGGEFHDGVHVLDGRELADWLRGYERGAVAQDNAERAITALIAFKERAR